MDRIKKPWDTISSNTDIEYISPLKFTVQFSNRQSACQIVSAYPVPVKKQEKYNIARWTVTVETTFG